MMTKSQTSYDDFAIDLEENAIDSLVHAIEHYQAFLDDGEVRNVKYAVLHSFHAVELVLKARMAKEHPILIFRDPGDIKKDRTATFDQLMGRLENCGVSLKSQRVHLDSLQKIRNDIEHYKIETKLSEVEGYIGKAIQFLDEFLRNEFDTTLGSELEDRLQEGDKAYEIVLTYLYEYKQHLAAVDRLIDDAIKKSLHGHAKEYCPSCGERALLLPDPRSPNSPPKCFFCSEIPVIRECEICGSRMIFKDLPQHDLDRDICEKCQNRIFDRF
jgi:hypothetical protein